jgi:hypothetical protein
MAARRLLIVMLVLLGLSTLAAALVPQHSLRDGNTSSTTTTKPATTTTKEKPPPGYVQPTRITVGGKTFPVVAPVEVGQQLVLLVASRVPTQLEIQEFGQIGYAVPNAPARFELLPTTPGTFGIQFQPSGKVAAQIRVVAPGAQKKQKKVPKKGKRPSGGSG